LEFSRRVEGELACTGCVISVKNVPECGDDKVGIFLELDSLIFVVGEITELLEEDRIGDGSLHLVVLVRDSVDAPIIVEAVVEADHGDAVEDVLDDLHGLLFATVHKDDIAHRVALHEQISLLFLTCTPNDVVVTSIHGNGCITLVHVGDHTLLEGRFDS